MNKFLVTSRNIFKLLQEIELFHSWLSCWKRLLNRSGNHVRTKRAIKMTRLINRILLENNQEKRWYRDIAIHKKSEHWVDTKVNTSQGTHYTFEGHTEALRQTTYIMSTITSIYTYVTRHRLILIYRSEYPPSKCICKLIHSAIRSANSKTGQNTTSGIEYLGITVRRLFNAYRRRTTQHKLCWDTHRTYYVCLEHWKRLSEIQI